MAAAGGAEHGILFSGGKRVAVVPAGFLEFFRDVRQLGDDVDGDVGFVYGLKSIWVPWL